MIRLFAGLDVSTQGCKLVVIDDQAGNVVHVDAVDYDRDLPEYRTSNGVIADAPEGVSESDPTMWIAAVELVLGRLAAAGVRADEIRCISVSGQQHGLVALDAEGGLARPRSKLWNDHSTAEECELLTRAVGGVEAMIREVGNSQRPGYTASKILHMVRHEPEVYERTATLFLVHNYINWYLTGGVSIMEPGDTSGTALWNPVTGAWSEVVLRAIDPGLSGRLPPIAPSDRTIGRIGDRLVERFGLSAECTVDAGCGDNMYGAVGTGNVTPGIVTVSLGTSGTAYTVSDEPIVDPEGEIAAFRDSTGRHMPLLCVSNMANGYDRMIERFELSHEQFSEIVELTPPGNRGRLLIPWYAGERTPDVPHGAAVQFGFGPDDLTREILCRAVLEGHVLNLYDGFRRMPGPVREIRLTGGLSRSTAWCQAIADIFDAVTMPVAGEGAALGAATHAAWVWRREHGDDVSLAEVVSPFVVLEGARRYEPRPEHGATYAALAELFGALSRRVRGLDGPDPFELRASLQRDGRLPLS
jgi:xylulokinase